MQNTEYHSLRKCPFCGAKVAYFGTVADIELMDDDYPFSRSCALQGLRELGETGRFETRAV